jgi:hypothetical protein
MAQHIQSVQQIPAEVQQLAEIHSLGAPTASYSKRTFAALLCPIVLPICFMLVCVVVFFGSGALGLTLYATIVGGGGIAFYVYVFPKRQVYMYTEGFVYLRWRKAEALRYRPAVELCPIESMSEYGRGYAEGVVFQDQESGLA